LPRESGDFFVKNVLQSAKRGGHELPSWAKSAALGAAPQSEKTLIFRAEIRMRPWHGLCDTVSRKQISRIFAP
jgi:hypothetical protein